MNIAVGNSRMDKKWKNKDISWSAFKDTVRTTQRTTETVSEYRKMTKAQQDSIKDIGGFVGGALREGKRRNGYVLGRSMLTLDMDYASPDIWAQIESLYDWTCCLYSTHKHTPESPRLRLVIPLARDVSEDEYPAIGRMVAKEIGIDMFDDTTYEPSRLMYWPSTSADGEFIFQERDGVLLDPDRYLSKYADWRDTAMWPTSKRQSEVILHTLRQQQDPFQKSGVVGAFCRAYCVEDAIATFLPHIYEPAALEGRFDYIPADSSAGLVVYDGKFAFSHHATDPVCGKLLNAFDLVRLHHFGDLDEKASFKAMSEFVVKDERVNTLLLEERRETASQDFSENEDWTKHLQRDRGGLLMNNLHNITLIMGHDPNLKAIVFNQLADGLEIKGEVPWKHPARFWRDADDAQLISYVDSHFGTFSARNYEIAVTKVTDDRSYHPIREYLNSLPPWDGTPRLETVLVDYLGADDNRYVRAVTRKTLCAAVARVLRPGIKFDNILVLNGPQGVGKSTFIARMGGDWYSDSLALTDMNDKTAAEKLQGYWLLEIGELAGMRKADIDKVKAFISRQDDKYRASFGRRVTPHPRQCVFFGTTNSDKGYLRDITGNRRFWTVKTPGHAIRQTWQMTAFEVSQIWAEAMVYVKAGEKLFLNADLEELAKSEQREAMEQDEREGLIRAYLDRLLPENWSEMSVYDRQDYIRSPEDPTQPRGVRSRKTVCNMEIWCECLGKHKEDMQPKDSYAIAAIMERCEGWSKTGKYNTLPIYGKQRLYERCEQAK